MTRTDGDVNVQDPGVVGRYFMRRLATAARKSSNRRVQYSNALADTAFVFVAMPLAGLFTFFVIASAKKHGHLAPAIPHLSSEAQGWIFGLLAMLIGLSVLNKRMKRYVRADPEGYLRFNTERDTSAADWQRLLVFLICAIALPVFGLIVLVL
jgi:hypothetical protein